MADKVPWFLDGMFVRMADYEKVKEQLEEAQRELATMTKVARAYENRMRDWRSDCEQARAQLEAYKEMEALPYVPRKAGWLRRFMENRG